MRIGYIYVTSGEGRMEYLNEFNARTIIFVGMMFQGKFLVGAVDLFECRILCDAENLIVVDSPSLIHIRRMISLDEILAREKLFAI